VLTFGSIGDQHKPNGSTTSNPFEEEKPRITEYTAEQVATLQARLDKQLGPEYISSRPGPSGQKVYYLAADKAIQLANEVFGFNGWSSSIQNIQIDFVDENAQGRISLGLSVIVRVTLKDGTYHEDTGYGQVENHKGKAAAFEKAKKEGTTDALKRAFRNFGNVLGNCVYDKDYIAKVSKMKVGGAKWDEKQLHRRADYAPKLSAEDVKPHVQPRSAHAPAPAPAKQEPQEDSPEFEDNFELGDFDELDFNEGMTGHPDEVVLPPEPVKAVQSSVPTGPSRPMPPARMNTTPAKPPSAAPPTFNAANNRPNPAAATLKPMAQPLPGQRAQSSSFPASRPPGDASGFGTDNFTRSSSPGTSSPHFGAPAAGTATGFYSAKAADNLDPTNNVLGPGVAAPRFNPHAESPSIRKTPNVDHGKSFALKKTLAVDTTPLKRPAEPGDEELFRGFATHDQPSAQPSGQSSIMRPPTTSGFRPPTRRGPVDTNLTTSTKLVQPGGLDRHQHTANRIPLGDVSNVQHHVTAATVDGNDAKRQRLSGGDQNGVPGGGGVADETKGG
jgi:DNA repair and recombination protein RAD52